MPLEYSLYLHKFLGGVSLSFREQFYLYVVFEQQRSILCIHLLQSSVYLFMYLFISTRVTSVTIINYTSCNLMLSFFVFLVLHTPLLHVFLTENIDP